MLLADGVQQAGMAWVDWITVVGFPLTLAGLYLTWSQARHATTAAEAARHAVQRTEQQIRARQLMVLIPQLVWTASDIDAAIEAEDYSLVRRCLNSWRRQAGNINGLLLAADPSATDMATALNTSVGLAAIAEGNLIRSGKKSTYEDCVKARLAIIVASDELNVWVGKNSTATSEQGGHNERR